ncbi:MULTISPECIES: sporulation protein YjcZ [unclassified Cohnella]|nr:sporulation protein YjcZ [Cohnella hashimotonis]
MGYPVEGGGSGAAFALVMFVLLVIILRVGFY